VISIGHDANGDAFAAFVEGKLPEMFAAFKANRSGWHRRAVGPVLRNHWRIRHRQKKKGPRNGVPEALLL